MSEPGADRRVVLVVELGADTTAEPSLSTLAADAGHALRRALDGLPAELTVRGTWFLMGVDAYRVVEVVPPRH